MLNKVKYIGSGYPGKPFSHGENMACFTDIIIGGNDFYIPLS